jgi:hypothetical protein
MNKEITKGFIAEIFEAKDFGNCSNNGISKWNKEVTIISDINECAVFDIDPASQLSRPLVVIKHKRIGGEDYVYAEPLEEPEGVGWMMGGCFIYSCDSRFRRHFSKYPIPLHDRQETQEQYEQLSI